MQATITGEITSEPEVFHFAGFALDTASLELCEECGARAEIPPLAFDLLVHLIRNRDRIVSKDELFETLWGEVSVTESSLSQSVWAARRAVRDTGGTQRVIKNIRGRGYRFVAELDCARTERAPTPPPPEPSVFVARPSLSPPGSPGLVGRAGEQARLLRALEATVAGEGRICLVAGPAGSGKSLLLQWLMRQAGLGSVRVLEGCCHDDAGTPPFWPWQQAARGLIAALSDERVGEVAGDLAGELVKLIPELEECLPDHASSPERVLSEDRFRLLHAVCQLFRRAAKTGPLVIVLEDLHWADAASLRLLDLAASVLPRAPVLLVASLRDQEVSPALQSSLDSILARSSAEMIELGGLDGAGVSALLTTILPAAPPDELVERVTSVTGGNPFFVAQLGGLIAAAGQSCDSLELPREASSVIRRRVSHLPPDVVGTLEWGAVLGNEFHVADLRRVSVLASDDLLSALELAVRSRIIEPRADTYGAYCFAHPTIRQTIHDDLPRACRLALHRRVADSLAEAYSEEPSQRADEIALHYFEAALDGDTAGAIRFGALAARGAFKATAYEESAAQYRRTLSLMTDAGPAGLRERCQILMGLGDAMHGAEAPKPEVRAQFLAAAEVATRLQDAPLLAEAAMRHAGRGALRFTVYREPGTVDATEIELLERALAALDDIDSPQRALVCAWLAYSLYNTGQPERRDELSGVAIAMARRLGDPRVLAEALLLRQNSERSPASLDERIEVQSEIIELSCAHGPRGLLLDAYSARAAALVERADLEGAARDFLAGERLAGELGDVWWKQRTFVRRRMHDLAMGQLEPVEKWLSTRAHSAEGARPDQMVAIVHFLVLLMRDRIDELVPGLEAYAERFPLPVAWHTGLIGAYAILGRHEQARSELARMRPDRFASLPDDHNWLASHSQLAYAAFELRDRESARDLYDNLVPYADRLILVGLGGPSAGSVERPLGELAFVLGDHERAGAHFARALEINEAAQAYSWAAWVELDWAEMLLEVEGRSSPRASALIASARSFAETRGLHLLTRRADRLASGG